MVSKSGSRYNFDLVREITREIQTVLRDHLLFFNVPPKKITMIELGGSIVNGYARLSEEGHIQSDLDLALYPIACPYNEHNFANELSKKMGIKIDLRFRGLPDHFKRLTNPLKIRITKDSITLIVADEYEISLDC